MTVNAAEPVVRKRRRKRKPPFNWLSTVSRDHDSLGFTLPGEILNEIERASDLNYLRADERRYLIRLVNQMRFQKRYGVPVATKLLTARFTQKGRDRICRLLKCLVAMGLMYCNDVYRQKTKGKCGISKVYGISAVLMVVDRRSEKEPHSSALPLETPQCVSPVCVRLSQSDIDEDYRLMSTAAESLGWDCFGVDVSEALAFPLSSLSCGLSLSEVPNFVLARDPGAADVNPVSGLSKLDVIVENMRKFEMACSSGRFSACRRNGRVYHDATGLPSYLRQRCVFTFDGQTSFVDDVDVSAMHWAILVSFMPHSQEKRLLVDACEQGAFYRLLEDRLAEAEERVPGGAFLPTETSDNPNYNFKVLAASFLLYRDRWTDRRRWGFDAALELAFPELRRALFRLHEYRSLRAVSFALTRIEGDITIHVVNEMNARRIPCLPYHDGTLVPKPYSGFCIELYRQRLDDVLGFVPMVRVKEPADGFTEILDCLDVDDRYFSEDEFGDF